MKMKLITAVVAAVNLSACATVVNGTKDTLKITSTPSQANVNITDISGDLTDRTCTTPCEIELKRKKTYDVSIAKEGFSPYKILVEPKLSAGNIAASTGNVLAGGIIGIGVDHATGAGKDLKPNPLIITLQPTGSSSFRTDKNGNKIEEVGTEIIETVVEPVASLPENKDKA